MSLIEKSLEALNYLPLLEKIEALKKLKTILADAEAINEQLERELAKVALDHRLSSLSRSVRTEIKEAVATRGAEWARSFFDETLEVIKVRKKWEEIDRGLRESTRKLEEALASAEGRIVRPTKEVGVSKEIVADSVGFEREHHRARRRLLIPRFLIRHLLRFDATRWSSGLVRWATMAVAGVLIFLLAGFTHHLDSGHWYLDFLALPLVVASLEYVAHGWVDRRIEAWGHRELHRLNELLAATRVKVVVDEALAGLARIPVAQKGS